jgi:sugar lactone lactonase YvrE
MKKINHKFQFLMTGIVLVLSILACQLPETTNVTPRLVATPTRSAGSVEAFPTAAPPTEEGLSAAQLTFLANPNTACFLHGGTALTCLDQNGWHIYLATEDFEFPFTAPSYINVCPDGRIYLEMYSSLYRLKGEELTEINMEGFYSVDGIACGPEDEIWVAHYEGVGHFDGSSWTDYPSSENLGTGEFVSLVNSIAIAPDGKVWVATADSVAAFDGAAWQVFEAGQGFAEDPSPQDLAVDALGNVWVIASDLLNYNGTQWSTIKIPKGIAQSIEIDGGGRIWVGTTQGLFVFDPETGNWVQSFGADSLSDDSVNDMQFDRQGRLWVVTDYGINIYDGATWSAYHMHTADLYENTADQIIVFGDGPQLPALLQKAPGSVGGRLFNPDGTPYTGWQVELCLNRVMFMFFGPTPCNSQPFHIVTSVDTEGYFFFPDVPVGHYALMIQLDSDTWRSWDYFDVRSGEETSLGMITVEQK